MNSFSFRMEGLNSFDSKLNTRPTKAVVSIAFPRPNESIHHLIDHLNYVRMMVWLAEGNDPSDNCNFANFVAIS